MIPIANSLRAWLRAIVGIALSKLVHIGSFYLLFIGLHFLNFGNYFCRELEGGTTFLLDNESRIPKALNMTFDDIYNLRKEFATPLMDCPLWTHPEIKCNYKRIHYRWVKNNDRGLLSEDNRITQKFSSINDLLHEFNLYGFHDVCNTLRASDVTKCEHDGDIYAFYTSLGMPYETDRCHLPPGFSIEGPNRKATG